MHQSTYNELRLWLVILLVGSCFLVAEVSVKASRSAIALPVETAEIVISGPLSELDAVSLLELLSSDNDEKMPEELVARLLVDAIIQVESGGRARLIGGKGERGLMQIREGTWFDTTRSLFGRPMAFERAFDPTMNRKVGTAYLAYLHGQLLKNRDRWQADERALLLAAYNAGPQRVAAAGYQLRRLPASTRDYINRAAALHDLYLSEHALKLEPARKRGTMQIVQVQPDQGT